MVQSITIKKQQYSTEPMASGSFVDIYRGVSSSNSSDVQLIKVIKKEYLKNAVIQKRFVDEFEILRTLYQEPDFFAKNPSFGQVDERSFLSYSFLDGETILQQLKRWSAEHHTPLDCCIRMERILRALKILHERDEPIVHSDLSPENLIVSGDEIYLIDMGCAQVLDEQSPVATRWIGKPSYLSPEQARGESWSTSSDIFQAGIVFYELLTGKRWNRGSTPQEKKVFASNPPALNFTPLPVEVRPVLRSMLKPEVAQRIKSVSLCLKRLQFARRALARRIKQ